MSKRVGSGDMVTTLMGDGMSNATYIDRLLMSSALSTPILMLIGNIVFSAVVRI